MASIKLAIVDDDPADAGLLERRLRAICLQRGLEAEIRCYSDGERFLAEAAGRTDIVFLDIELPAPDGLTLASALRQRDAQVIIIFVTSHEQYAIRGYEVNAYRYLVKPVDPTALAEACAKPLGIVAGRNRRFLNARENGNPVRIPLDAIRYIETAPSHRALLHTVEGDRGLSLSMRELEASLDPALFSRCHTSFIVNLRQIARFDKADLVLLDGTRIPISRHRRRDVMDAFMRAVEGYFS